MSNRFRDDSDGAKNIALYRMQKMPNPNGRTLAAERTTIGKHIITAPTPSRVEDEEEDEEREKEEIEEEEEEDEDEEE